MNDATPRSKQTLSRREFLGSAVAIAAGPLVLPSLSWGRSRLSAANDRIGIGCIGMGGMGTSNMDAFLGKKGVQVVAVCDVDRERREAARRRVDERYSADVRSGTYHGCAATGDFREVLARSDVDAVMIATPDHWHALIAIAAARAGKDIYCEKPLSLTIAQGRAMVDAVKRYGRVFQTGSQQRSSRDFRVACELVRNGRIGRVHTVQVGLPTGPSTDSSATAPVPEGFDYDFWLGPAPWAPYSADRCHWNFRWILDYSGGEVTDWGAHHCDIAQWGLGTERTGPIEVEGVGEYPREGLWDAATHYRFTCTYESGTKMIVTDAIENGVRFEGTDGWVFVNRERLDAQPKSLLGSTIAPNEIHLEESTDHHQNFLDAVALRRDPIAPVEVAHRSLTIAHLGNVAMQLGRKVRWDPARERIVGDEDAQRMTTRSTRSPW